MILPWLLACVRPAPVPTAASEVLFVPGIGSRELAQATERYLRGQPVDPTTLRSLVLDAHDVRIRGRLLELVEVRRHRQACGECYESALLAATDRRWDPQALHQLGLDELDAIEVDLEPLRGKAVLSQEATLALARPLTRCTVIEPEPGALRAHAGYRRGAVALHPTQAYLIPTLLAHECDPGHHTAEQVSASVEGWPLFMHRNTSLAVQEGWAHYAEWLAEEEGAFEGLGARGHLAARAWRAARVVVDTGIHHLGWTDEQARTFYRERTALTEDGIERDLARHHRHPGQLVAYTVGAVELRRLRERAEAALAERFVLTEFLLLVHHPGQSLSLLEGDVDQWIAETRGW